MDDYEDAKEFAEQLGEYARASQLKGELKIAEKAIRKSLILWPANAAIAVNLGSLESQADQVIAKMRWGQIIDPTNPGVLRNIAVAYTRAGDRGNALSTWRLLVLWMPSSASSAAGFFARGLTAQTFKNVTLMI